MEGMWYSVAHKYAVVIDSLNFGFQMMTEEMGSEITDWPEDTVGCSSTVRIVFRLTLQSGTGRSGSLRSQGITTDTDQSVCVYAAVSDFAWQLAHGVERSSGEAASKVEEKYRYRCKY